MNTAEEAPNQPTKATQEADKARRKEVVQTLATQLGETAEGPRAQLKKVVNILRPEQALAFLQETLALEAQGGLMLPDGSRRRTPGGVFFYLVRTKGPEAVQALWKGVPKKPTPEDGTPPESQQEARAPKPALPPQPPSAFEWQDRLAVHQEMGSEKGAATVKITLVGRPGKVVEKGSCVVTVMQATKVPPLPKGLPTPAASATTYTVYLSRKQWKNVAESIQDPEDVLILEGFPQLDLETASIAVFVTNATTKKLQAAKRQAPAKS